MKTCLATGEPMIINIKRDSTSIDELILNIVKKTAGVRFKDGSFYIYENVSRLEMIKVMADKSLSLGEWVNAHLVHGKPVYLEATQELKALSLIKEVKP